MKPETKMLILYAIAPLGTNGALAIGTFVFLSSEFTGSPTTCYLTALVATVVGLVSIVGFIYNDIGPLRTVAS